MMTDPVEKARSMIRAAVPKALEVLCETANDAEVTRRDRLSAVYVLLQCTKQGIWRPRSQRSRNALPGISTFLRSVMSDSKSKQREQLQATLYLLEGIDLKLWEKPHQSSNAK
jgi:hypothetical protein